VSKSTFYTRVLDWYKRGYRQLVGVSEAEGAYLVPIRKILQSNGIEYHNVAAAGRSIYVRQEDAGRAHLLTCHLQTAWFQKKVPCFKCKGEGGHNGETCDLCNGHGYVWSCHENPD